MTGTSLDAIDVAVATIEGTGLGMRARLRRHRATDLGPLRDDLREAACGQPMTAQRFAGHAGTLGCRHAAALRAGAGLAVLAVPAPLVPAALTIAPSATGLALPTDADGNLVPSLVAALLDTHLSK